MSKRTKRLIRYPNRIPLLNIFELRTIVGKEDIYDYTILLCDTNLNDGGATEYYWKADSLKTDDNKNVIKPTTINSSLPGRWLKVKRESPWLSLVMNASITGDNVTKIFPVAHNFRTRNVIVQVITEPVFSTGVSVDIEVVLERHIDKIDVIFNEPVSSNVTYIVMIMATELVTI